MASSLSNMSYNMHGFSQGITYLQESCNLQEFDVIFIQEHWLVPALMNKTLNVNNNYICYGKSAMDQIVGNNLLKGRL